MKIETQCLILGSILSVPSLLIASPQTKEPAPRQCTAKDNRCVFGRVIDAASSNPLAGIRVGIVTDDRKPVDKVPPSRTDNKGLFQVELPEDIGNFQLEVDPTGGGYWVRYARPDAYKPFPLNVKDIPLEGTGTLLTFERLNDIRTIEANLRRTDPARADSIAKALARQPIAAIELAALHPAPTPEVLYQSWAQGFKDSAGGSVITYATPRGGGIAALGGKSAPDVAFTSATPRRNDVESSSLPLAGVPIGINAVAVVYDLPGILAPIKLDADTLTGIYVGKIERWNDPAIARLNPDLELPALKIVAVHRSDASAETSLFTSFLDRSCTGWKAAGLTAGPSVSWPAGLAAKGDEGIQGTVNTQPGAIGYVSFASARGKQLSVASVRNRFGFFAAPSIASIAAFAGERAAPVTTLSAPEAEAATFYPISEFTWVFFLRDSGSKEEKPDPAEARRQDFVHWLLTAGQGTEKDLGYVPLPSALRPKVEAAFQNQYPKQILY